jgi:hypothetical protein
MCEVGTWTWVSVQQLYSLNLVKLLNKSQINFTVTAEQNLSLKR